MAEEALSESRGIVGTKGFTRIRLENGPPHQGRVLLQARRPPAQGVWADSMEQQWPGRACPQQRWSAMEWPNDFTGTGHWVWSVVQSSARTCCSQKEEPTTEDTYPERRFWGECRQGGGPTNARLNFISENEMCANYVF